MTLSIQPYKGARDFYPQDKRLQKYMFNTMRKVVERFGYEEYDAPILEPLEMYLAKSGAEIINEQTYTFVDRGGRQVAIRPEMTPTVSRMVAAKRQELGYPLRWYSIPNLWRYERPQRGRLREHWQLNVDLFGIAGLAAEHETIIVADSLMQAFGAKRDMYSIRINSRRLMDELLQHYLVLDSVQSHSIAKLIDSMPKMDYAEFVAQTEAVLNPRQRENGTGDRLRSLLKVTSPQQLPPLVAGHPSVIEVNQLLTMLEKAGITNAVFDITLMRGFDYYTDIIFEVFDKHPDNNRSMFGGGRYDGLVGLFGAEPVPTVGFGMGDVTLQNFLESHSLLPQLKTEAELYTVIVGDVYLAAHKAVQELRDMGLNVIVDASGRKPDKQIKTADKKGVRFILFIGEEELANQHYTLKDLKTGQTEKRSLERIVTTIKDYRRTD